MKKWMFVLVFGASLPASAQVENCSVLGVQELSSLYQELSSSIDTIVETLSGLSEASQSLLIEEVASIQIDYNSTINGDAVGGESERFRAAVAALNDSVAAGWRPLSPHPISTEVSYATFYWQWTIARYAEQ